MFKIGDKVKAKEASEHVVVPGTHTVTGVREWRPDGKYGKVLDQVMLDYSSSWFHISHFDLVSTVETDKTNPNHYAVPVQPVTFIRMLGLNFNRGNIVKYACRAGLKPDEDPIDDLKKVIRYAEAEIKAIEIERKIALGADKDIWKDGI